MYDCHRGLHSSLVECFLDDDALGGEPEDVLGDSHSVINNSKELSLEMDIQKCKTVVLRGTADEQQGFTNFSTNF